MFKTKPKPKTMAYVYTHIRLDTNQPFYIGVGSDEKYKRAYQKVSRNEYWKNIVSKTNYIVEIILIDLSWEDACKKEIEFISLYGRKDLNKGILCNLTNGGEGAIGVIRSKEFCERKSKEMKEKKLYGEKNPFYGKKHSSESIKIMAEKRKGKALTEETKLKMSKKLKGRFKGEKNPMFGRVVSEETRKKMSDALTGCVGIWRGKKRNQEFKDKISKALKGRKHSQESIKKMSDAQKGKKFSLEHRQNISKAKQNQSLETRRKISESLKLKKRKPHSEETKRKIGLSNKGKIISIETRKKISESKKTKNQKKYEKENSLS